MDNKYNKDKSHVNNLDLKNTALLRMANPLRTEFVDGNLQLLSMA